MLKTKKDKICAAVCVVLIIAIIAVIIVGLTREKKPAAVPAPLKVETPTERVVYRDVERIVQVEKQIECEMIEDGLRDMGMLITGEYYFTGVITYTSAKELWNMKLPFTESGYLVSYDGVVSAGVDFTALKISENTDTGTIVISVPKPVVHSVDIDHESFTLYSEKQGFGNPISASEFNDSLIDFEHTAVENAAEKGLFDRAEANARSIIKNFAEGLIAGDGRSVAIIFT